MHDFVATYETCCKACGVEPIKAIIRVAENSLPQEDDAEGKEEAPSRGIELDLEGNSLELFKRRVTNNDVQALASAVSKSSLLIKRVSLAFNELTDACMESIMQIVLHGQVEQLDLSSNMIGPDGLQMLLDVVASRRCSLSHVKLRENPLGNRGGLAIAQLLHSDDSILHLDVSNCDLETESLIAIATALRGNASLQSLYLEKPHVFSFDDEITTHISNMLTMNSTLRVLSLGKHRIRCTGAAILADGLASNRSLRVLDLRCNEISIAGAKSLARLLLSKASKLSELNLEANRVADEGAAAIGAALEYCENIESVNLRGNSIKDEGLVAIADGMAVNSSIRELRLWGNHFGPKSSKMFFDLAQGRFTFCDIALDFVPWEADQDVIHVAQN